MTVTFVVPGMPQGKGRPRFMRNGHTYTPDKTRKYERLIREAYLLQSGHFYDRAVLALCIYACFPIPKSYTKKQRELIRAGKMFPLVKPDGDNIAKAVMDALNGIAYDDDKQIADIRCFKRYACGDSRSECLIVSISDEVINVERQT